HPAYETQGRRRACRSCGARLLPLCCAPVHRRRKGSSIHPRGRSRLHNPDWTNLDNTVVRGRAASRPRDCGIEIGNIDQVVATQLLLRVRIRSIQHLRLAIDDAHGRCRRAWLKSICTQKRASLLQCLGIGSVSRLPFLLLRARQLGPTGFIHMEQQQVLHVRSPSPWTGNMRRLPNDVSAIAIWTATSLENIKYLIMQAFLFCDGKQAALADRFLLAEAHSEQEGTLAR